MLIKIIFLLFIVFVLAKTVWRFFKKEISGRELVAWLVFWVLVGTAVVLPQTTDLLAAQVEEGRVLAVDAGGKVRSQVVAPATFPRCPRETGQSALLEADPHLLHPSHG